MIVVDMNGSMGDLLFQYATAKSLAIDRNSNLLMDINNNEDFIDSKLKHFNFVCNKISRSEISYGRNIQKIVESDLQDTFDNFIDFNNYDGDIYLKGRWQNEKYFKHNRLSICNDLTVKTPPDIKNERMLYEINESESVCFSFRQSRFSDSYF